MTEQNDEKLREIAERATPGPWKLDGGTVILSAAPWPMEYGPSWQDWEAKGGEPLGRFVAETRTAEEEGEANAEFIATFNPQVVLKLLSDKAALEAERDEAREIAACFTQVEKWSAEHAARLSAEARATASEAERDGLRAALEDVLRLADMGFEESMKEPEENGNFAAYERARFALAALKETSDAG